MFRPLSLYIGLRYTRAKRSSNFISFIAAFSMIGIALGVAVLITVLSVMNGFDLEIHKRFFGMAPQITVTNYETGISEWPKWAARLQKYPGVVGVAPFIGEQALISSSGYVKPSVITGVLPSQEPAVTNLAQKMLSGKLDALQPGKFGIVLGETLANNLAANVGDKVRVMIPKVSITLAGIIPRMKAFTVVGIFSAGSGFNFNANLAFINLNDAQALFQLGDRVTGLRLKIKNIYAAPPMSQQIADQLPLSFAVGNWTMQFGAFFRAIKMEKTMMFLILSLIIAVAAFNLISSLFMTVNDKQSDIAILRTFGARPRTILGIFMIQGTMIGVIGTLLGIGLGIILSLNATAIVNWIQATFHTQLLSSNVYFVDFLPSHLEWSDIWHVTLVALALSFLATIYPAWRASRTQPAEALRYD